MTDNQLTGEKYNIRTTKLSQEIPASYFTESAAMISKNPDKGSTPSSCLLRDLLEDTQLNGLLRVCYT